MNNKLHIKDLGPRQLWNLRKDCVVGSLFVNEYMNRYHIDPYEAINFFDSWLDDLADLMKDEIKNYNDNDFFYYFRKKYDKPKYLNNFANTIEW